MFSSLALHSCAACSPHSCAIVRPTRPPVSDSPQHIFLTVNVKVAREVFTLYRVDATPTAIVFGNGKQLDRCVLSVKSLRSFGSQLNGLAQEALSPPMLTDERDSGSAAPRGRGNADDDGARCVVAASVVVSKRLAAQAGAAGVIASSQSSLQLRI